MEKAYLERHWEETAKKRQDLKLQKEAMDKQAAQQATNDFLGMQMQIKQSQQAQAQQEYQREMYEVRARAEQVRAANFHQKQRGVQEQERLKVSLESQISEASFRRIEDLKMTERERLLHLGPIQRQAAPTFVSVPGIHPREIPLMKVLPQLTKSSSMANSYEAQPNYQTSSYSALPKSMDAAARDFYGVETSPVGSPPLANEYRRVEYSYDPRRHDPIVNPIGSVIPRPLLGQDLRKGRGRSTLGAAGSAALNR
jgi:hypothetical protein